MDNSLNNLSFEFAPQSKSSKHKYILSDIGNNNLTVHDIQPLKKLRHLDTLVCTNNRFSYTDLDLPRGSAKMKLTANVIGLLTRWVIPTPADVADL